jgi:hypothetical protein
MLPKNSKHYIIPTAEELDYDSNLVADVVGFYYNSLRKALSNLDCHFIQVENLGSFKIKQGRLPEFYAKYTQQLKSIKPTTETKAAILRDIEHNLDRIKNAQEMIKEDKQRRIEFYKKKKDGKSNTRTDLEK